MFVGGTGLDGGGHGGLILTPDGGGGPPPACWTAVIVSMEGAVISFDNASGPPCVSIVFRIVRGISGKAAILAAQSGLPINNDVAAPSAAPFSATDPTPLVAMPACLANWTENPCFPTVSANWSMALICAVSMPLLSIS